MNYRGSYRVVLDSVETSASGHYKLTEESVRGIATFAGDDWEFISDTVSGRLIDNDTASVVTDETFYAIRNVDTGISFTFLTNSDNSIFRVLTKHPEGKFSSCYQIGGDGNFTPFIIIDDYLIMFVCENGNLLFANHLTTTKCVAFLVGKRFSFCYSFSQVSGQSTNEYFWYSIFNENGVKVSSISNSPNIGKFCFSPYFGVLTKDNINDTFAFMELKLRDGYESDTGLYTVAAGPAMVSTNYWKTYIIEGKVYLILAKPSCNTANMFAMCLGDYSN